MIQVVNSKKELWPGEAFFWTFATCPPKTLALPQIISLHTTTLFRFWCSVVNTLKWSKVQCDHSQISFILILIQFIWIDLFQKVDHHAGKARRFFIKSFIQNRHHVVNYMAKPNLNTIFAPIRLRTNTLHPTPIYIFDVPYYGTFKSLTTCCPGTGRMPGGIRRTAGGSPWTWWEPFAW